MLAHPWVLRHVGSTTDTSLVSEPEMLQRMRAFAAYSDLRKAALKVRVSFRFENGDLAIGNR